MKQLIDTIKGYGVIPAIIWNGEVYNYNELFDKYKFAQDFIKNQCVKEGEIISLTGDFTPNTIALMFALINNNNIIVPFNHTMKESEYVKFEISCVQKSIIVDVISDNYVIEEREANSVSPVYESLIQSKKAGLVLFTSGTSGKPKGAVHNFSKLLDKFNSQRKALRTINFLLFDHWGGLNTMFHTLSNGGVVLALNDRKPESICAFIEKHQIELLPASPTFLNLLLMSDSYKKYDLSSIQLITYGTEPMPISTLKRLKAKTHVNKRTKKIKSILYFFLNCL